LAKHVKRGDDVILLALTYGVNVHTEKLVGKSVEEIKGINREQSIKAGMILGINDYTFLDCGDQPLKSTREKQDEDANLTPRRHQLCLATHLS